MTTTVLSRAQGGGVGDRDRAELSGELGTSSSSARDSLKVRRLDKGDEDRDL